MALDPDVAAFAAAGMPRAETLTPAADRAIVDKGKRARRAEPAAARMEDVRIPAPHRDIPARLYAHGEDAASTPVFFLGGGLVAGSIDTHDELHADTIRAAA